jgi:hypothetical protein
LIVSQGRLADRNESTARQGLAASMRFSLEKQVGD